MQYTSNSGGMTVSHSEISCENEIFDLTLQAQFLRCNLTNTTRRHTRVYDIGLDRDDCAVYIVYYDDATWRRL